MGFFKRILLDTGLIFYGVVNKINGLVYFKGYFIMDWQVRHCLVGLVVVCIY